MWPNPHETASLVTFAEEIFNGKLHFLYGDSLAFINLLNNFLPVKSMKKVLLQKWKVLLSILLTLLFCWQFYFPELVAQS